MKQQKKPSNQKIAELGKSHQSETDSGLDSVIYTSPQGYAESDISTRMTKKQMTMSSSTSSSESSSGGGAPSGGEISVAVKRPLPNGTHENYLDLKEELSLMFKVGQHLNIVNLIGK